MSKEPKGLSRMLLEELKVEMDLRNLDRAEMNRAKMIIAIREDCIHRQRATSSATGANQSTSAPSSIGQTFDQMEYWNQVEDWYHAVPRVPPKAPQPPPPYPKSFTAAKAASRLINIPTDAAYPTADRTMNRVTDEDYEMPDLRAVRMRTPRTGEEQA